MPLSNHRGAFIAEKAAVCSQRHRRVFLFITRNTTAIIFRTRVGLNTLHRRASVPKTERKLWHQFAAESFKFPHADESGDHKQTGTGHDKTVPPHSSETVNLKEYVASDQENQKHSRHV